MDNKDSRPENEKYEAHEGPELNGAVDLEGQEDQTVQPEPPKKSKAKSVAIIVTAALLAIAAVPATFLILQANAKYKEREQLSAELPKPKVQVTITSSEFSPSTIKIAPGDYVAWTNNDESAHQLRFMFDGDDTGESYTNDSEKIEVAGTFSRSFDKAGTYKYYDETNPVILKGTIIVGQE